MKFSSRTDLDSPEVLEELITPEGAKPAIIVPKCVDFQIALDLDKENQSEAPSKFKRYTYNRHGKIEPAEGNSGEESETARGFVPAFRRSMRLNRFASRRYRQRVVFKSGECNVNISNLAKRRRRYLADIFTTLVDIQWRWNLLVFAMGFFLSWLFFAILWWTIAFAHEDLERFGEEGFVPCVANVFSFTSCFLFSIETQHTIGYGFRYTTEECPEAIFLMSLQSIVGVMIQSFMVGVVFAKLSRPKKRTQTLMFSRNAVLTQRDGKLCLMFRVGDMRKSHIISANIRAQLIRRKVTEEGEVIPFYQHELDVGMEMGEDRLLFIWPITIVHIIDKRSPFYEMSADDLRRERFELIVVLEGCIESTGMTTQARSSYLPKEIMWGHRFDSLVAFNKQTGEYQVDYSLFNSTLPVDTPLCSAKDLDDFEHQKRETVQRLHRRKTSLRLDTAELLLAHLAELAAKNVAAKTEKSAEGKDEGEREVSSPTDSGFSTAEGSVDKGDQSPNIEVFA